jgi:catechol 2,3-dioxygenase-like lactoylglutathione lyase family enzyme
VSNLRSISPFFIVANLQTSVAFYKDKLGFELQYMGPAEDPYFAIVGRDQVSIMLKQIAADILPIPNHSRHEWARLDAHIYAADPDRLFEEYQTRGITFFKTIEVNTDNLRGFEIKDADGYVLFFGRPEKN